MGLKENASSGVQYVRLKDGKFYLNSDLTKPYDELEGMLTGIRFKDDEWEGNKIRKCNFGLTDSETGITYVVGLSVDSSYFSTLVGFLKNADLTKPMTFHPKVNKYKKEDKTDGERRTIMVSQDGVFLKSFYSKDSGNKLPDFKKVKVSNKIVYDKTDFLEAIEEVVTKDFVPNLPKQEIVTHRQPAVNADVPNAKEPDVTTEGDEKLPWDE